MKYSRILMIAICLQAGVSNLRGQAVILAGDSMYWELTTDSVLTITGRGDLPSFANPNPSTAQGTLISNPWDEHRLAIKKLVIGRRITGICEYTVYGENYPNLEEITMSDFVTIIGQRSASGGVESGGYDVLGAPNVTSITFSKRLEGIGMSAILVGEHLSTIRIPKSVKFIGWAAFDGVSYTKGLEDIYVEWTDLSQMPTLDGEIFRGTAPHKTLHVPIGTTALYSSGFWGNPSLFTNIVEYDVNQP